MYPAHRIRRIGLADIAESLPAAVRWAEEYNCPGGVLYICALGFEPRCLSVSDQMAKSGTKFANCLYLEYMTNVADNNRTLRPLRDNLEKLSDRVHTLNADADNYVSLLSDLLEEILDKSAVATPPAVYLDISGFANRFVISTMRAILEKNCRLTILYSEAGIYHPTESEYRAEPARWSDENQLGLERGVSDVRISRAYPGAHLDQLPDCIILFPSFRATRSLNVVSAVDPAYLLESNPDIIWMVGVPHLTEDGWREDVMRELNRVGESATSYSVSTFDYRESVRALERVYEENGGQRNFTISPLGSKMQAVGIALFCAYREDVRIMESVPKEYNASSYSEGSKALWRVEFGDTKALRFALNKVGTLVMEKADALEMESESK